MGELMDFPETFEEFAKQYQIIDKQEVYTNGAELIPVFRVQQWLEHFTQKTIKAIDFAIKATDGKEIYFVGMRNGLRLSKSYLDNKEPIFEDCTGSINDTYTEEEIKKVSESFINDVEKAFAKEEE